MVVLYPYLMKFHRHVKSPTPFPPRLAAKDLDGSRGGEGAGGWGTDGDGDCPTKSAADAG
jgi:hypothetical protein